MRNGPITQQIRQNLLADLKIAALQPTEGEIDAMIATILQQWITHFLKRPKR